MIIIVNRNLRGREWCSCLHMCVSTVYMPYSRTPDLQLQLQCVLQYDLCHRPHFVGALDMTWHMHYV